MYSPAVIFPSAQSSRRASPSYSPKYAEEAMAAVCLKSYHAFDGFLSKKHPQNHNIRPKIRQQLQILRDQGFVEFVERGLYRKKSR